MKSRSVLLLSSAFALCFFAFSRPSEAQPQNTPDVLPPAGGNGGAGPATDPQAPSQGGQNGQNGQPQPAATPKSSGNLGGVSYDDKPRGGTRSSAPAVSHGRYRANGPVVNIPGFEQTADGGTRLFVQLSQSVPVEERKAQGTITYVLKGASPRVWNNTNALVTVHFNTPVSRARLVPQGSDLLFIVEMRANASPTWKMNDSQDKSAMLSIDFPKGDYLAASTSAAAPAAAQPGSGTTTTGTAPTTTTTTPTTTGRPGGGKGRGGKRGGARPAPPPATGTN